MCVPGTSGDDRDPYAWLRQLGRAAPVVQLQQSDAEGDHHWPFTAERNAAGRIDADRVLEALGEGGVDESVLILEVIPPFEQDDEAVARRPGRVGRPTGARRSSGTGSATAAEPTSGGRSGQRRASSGVSYQRTRSPTRPGPSSRATSGRASMSARSAATWASTGYGASGTGVSATSSAIAGGCARPCGRTPSPRRAPTGSGRGRSARVTPSGARSADEPPDGRQRMVGEEAGGVAEVLVVRLPDLELGQEQVGQVEGRAVGRQPVAAARSCGTSPGDR